MCLVYIPGIYCSGQYTPGSILLPGTRSNMWGQGGGFLWCLCLEEAGFLAFFEIRRPLPSLGPGGAAPGITAGVRLWPARTSACMVGPADTKPFATAFPSHREHVALQQQSFASAWPVAILHLEGFKTCAKHGPSRHKTSLWAFTALPLPSQVTSNTLPFSGITTQNPSVGLYRFATAFPGHRKHVALQRQPFASAFPVAILHLEGFKTCAKHGPSGHKTPLWAFTALPLPSLQRQSFASAWPCRHTPFRGF